MKGYFDDEEAERGEPKERARDTELTLTTGAQLGIVFCLLLLCGLCFGLGYWVGHRGSSTVAEKTATQPAVPTPAPDQEPLQGSDTIPKPSANAQVTPTQPPAGGDGTTPAPASSPNTAPKQPAAEQPEPPASPPVTKPVAPASPAPAPPKQPAQVRPTHPTETYEPQPERPVPAARPAFSGAPVEYTVQIAAVSHAEDANVLVNALRKRGYAAMAERSPSDGLIHVRIGPFATHEEANRMCTRLLESGYNAMVQP